MFLESAEARLLGLIAVLVATAMCGISVARGAAGRRRSVKRLVRAPEPKRSSWEKEKEALELHNNSGMPHMWNLAHPGPGHVTAPPFPL